MDELRFFCLDSRIRDVNGACQVVHFSRDLEDESILIIDSFEPYVYVTSPFEDDSFERIRDRIRAISPTARIENRVFKKADETVQSAKVSVATIEAYRGLREAINARPEHFLELFPRAKLLKRYLLERDLVPLTVWSASAEPFPHDARVPAYLASSIEQNDTMTYENPSCESFTILPESLTHSLIASHDPIRAVLFSSSALSWDRSIVQRAQARYVDSEIDLIDGTRRHLIASRPAILAGFRSDSVDFPRILTRVASYKESGQRVNFSLSDDFSLPYSTRYGTSVLGMIHLDVAKATEIVSALPGYEDLEPLLSQLSLEVHGEGIIDGHKRLVQLVSAAALKLYPLFAELSQACCEQVYDVSRQPAWRTYESYVDTYCIKRGLCYDRFGPHEPFRNAPLTDMAEADVVFADHAVRIPHVGAHIAVRDNVSRESARETRKGDGSTISFTDAASGPLEALRAVLDRRTRLSQAAHGLEDAPVTARLRAYELLAQGFEQAIGNRACTLYFPEGANYIRRREYEELGRASRHVSAIVDQYIFTQAPEALDARLKRLGIDHERVDLKQAIITHDPPGAIMMLADHEIETAGSARLDRTVPAFVSFVRDILARKILLEADDVEAYVREKIEELISGRVPEEELVSLVTMHRQLEEYEHELYFVQAARELRSQGFVVEPGVTIPYVVIEDGDLRGAPPGTHAPIAYRYYASSKLEPTLSSLLKAAGYEGL
jgi:DNA polymerase elongation subunit (family B)